MNNNNANNLNVVNNSNLNFFLLSITCGIECNSLDLVFNSFIKYKLELNKIINYNTNNNNNKIIIDSEIIKVLFQIFSINNNIIKNNNNNNSNCINQNNNNNNTLYQLKIEASKLLVQVIKLLNIKKEVIIDLFQQISHHCYSLCSNNLEIEFDEISIYLPFFKGIGEHLENDNHTLLYYCKSLEYISRIARADQDVLRLLNCLFDQVLKILYKSSCNGVQDLCLKFILNLLNNGSEIDIQKFIDLEIFSKLIFLLLNFFNDKTCFKLQIKLIDISIGSVTENIQKEKEKEEPIIVTGRSILKKIVLLLCDSILKSNFSQFYYFDQFLNSFHFLQVFLLKYQLLDQFTTQRVLFCLNFMVPFIFSNKITQQNK